jgi:hypothetical protein
VAPPTFSRATSLHVCDGRELSLTLLVKGVVPCDGATYPRFAAYPRLEDGWNDNTESAMAGLLFVE